MLCRNHLIRLYTPIFSPRRAVVQKVQALAQPRSFALSRHSIRLVSTTRLSMSEQTTRPDAAVIPADQVNPAAPSETVMAPAEPAAEGAAEGEKKPSKKGGTSYPSATLLMYWWSQADQQPRKRPSSPKSSPNRP